MKKSFISTHRGPVIWTSIGIVISIILIFLPHPSYKNGFDNLDAAISYAKATDETIKPDTDDTIRPQFNNYYQTLTPTWHKNISTKILWILIKLGLHNPPAWTPEFFQQQLNDISKLRETNGYKENFICKVTPTLQSKIVIFGNLQGAFHSFVRDLVKLKELGIIDASFKVTSPDHYIILMGDVVSRSPFSMETLSLAMRIMQANPDNMLYLKGNHETANYWQEHSLKKELQTRAAHLSSEDIPLANEVNRFFNTLPLAIYISEPKETPQEFVRISDSGRGQNKLLTEYFFAKFLTAKTDKKITCLQLTETQSEQTGQPIDIKVIFKGEKKRETFQPHQGLRLLPSDLGSTAWTILSCPTPVYQKALKFVHDAFVILTPARRFDDWKITLYSRNVLENKEFSASTLYLISGTAEGTRTAQQQPEPDKEIPQQEQKAIAPQEPASKPVTPQRGPLEPAFDPI